MSNRIIELEARSPLLFSVLGLLLMAYAWPIWLQHTQLDRITRMEATIQQQTSILDAALGNALPVKMSTLDRITRMEATIQQQTSILDAALGNALPVKMSTEWERRLEELEAVVEDPGQWPGNASQAEEFIDKLSRLISELSPLSEASYFPRLQLVRWAAVAFEGLHRTPSASEPFDNLAEWIRAIADAKPEGIVSDLDQELRKKADNITEMAENQMIKDTIQEARRYLNNEETTKIGIAEIYEILGIYEDNSQQGVEIRNIRTKLQHRMAMLEAQEQARALDDQWAKAKALAANQPAVYEIAANALLREVTTARAVLALQGIRQPSYDNLEGEIRRAVEEMEDKIRREYQRWALTRIVAFQKTHEALSDEAAEEAGFLGFGINAGWSDDRFREVRDAMVSRLLPIDQSLLDLPVLMRYRREFDKGWNRLDGREEQTSVAEASALTRKRTFHNFK